MFLGNLYTINNTSPDSHSRYVILRVKWKKKSIFLDMIREPLPYKEWGIIKKFPKIKRNYFGKYLKQGALIVFYVDVILQLVHMTCSVFVILLLKDIIESNEFTYQIITKGLDINREMIQIVFSVAVLILDYFSLYLGIKRGNVYKVAIWLKITAVIFVILVVITTINLALFLLQLDQADEYIARQIVYPTVKILLGFCIRIVWNFYAIAVVKNYYFELKFGNRFVDTKRPGLPPIPLYTIQPQPPVMLPPRPSRTTAHSVIHGAVLQNPSPSKKS